MMGPARSRSGARVDREVLAGEGGAATRPAGVSSKMILVNIIVCFVVWI
jgi:hypothetical protein